MFLDKLVVLLGQHISCCYAGHFLTIIHPLSLALWRCLRYTSTAFARLVLLALVVCWCFTSSSSCHRHQHSLCCCRKQSFNKTVLGETDCSIVTQFQLALVENQSTHWSVVLYLWWEKMLCPYISSVVTILSFNDGEESEYIIIKLLTSHQDVSVNGNRKQMQLALRLSHSRYLNWKLAKSSIQFLLTTAKHQH